MAEARGDDRNDLARYHVDQPRFRVPRLAGSCTADDRGRICVRSAPWVRTCCAKLVHGAGVIDHEVADNGHCIANRRQKELENHVGAVEKTKLRRAQVKLPHAAEPLIVQGRRPCPVGSKTLAPMVKRIVVMQSQDLHICDPKACPFCRSKHLGQSRHVASRKDIFANEWARRSRRAHPSNAVHESEAVIG